MLFSRLATLSLHKHERYNAGDDSLEPEILRLMDLFGRLWRLKLSQEEHGHRRHNNPHLRRVLRAETFAILAEDGITLAGSPGVAGLLRRDLLVARTS